MAWFVVHRKDTGEAVSEGDVLADPLPGHLVATKVSEGGRPDPDTFAWDPATKTMRRLPPWVDVDHVDVLLGREDVKAFLAGLTAAQRGQAHAIVAAAMDVAVSSGRYSRRRAGA